MGTPDPRLRGHVLGAYQGWKERNTAPVVRWELPKLMVPVILNLGPRFGVMAPGNGAGMEPFDSFVAGLHDRYAVTESQTQAACLQVNLTPLGAYQLLGPRLGTLPNRVVDLELLFGAEARRLIAQLRETPGWEARFAILDGFIAGKVADAKPLSPAVAWSLQELVRSDGTQAVGGLSDSLGCSRKRLITLFRNEIGLTPKKLARMLRFTGALDRLDREPGYPLAALAQDCGYYDQAHFNREFRAFAGWAPGEFLKNRLPQDVAGALN